MESQSEAEIKISGTDISFPESWRHHPIGSMTAVFAVFTAVYIVWQVFQWGGEAYKTFINDAAQAATSLAAFAVTWKLSRSSVLNESTRRPWRLVSFAYFFFACSQTLWFYYRQVEGIAPFPSFVDIGFLAFYPMMLHALRSFPTAERTRADRKKFFLDAATVMIAGTMVVWHFIIGPTLEKNTDLVKSVLNVSFIVGDLVLFLGIITILLRRPPESVRRALYFIIAGLLNLFLADISFAYITLHGFSSGGPLVVLWVTGPFLLIMASFCQYRGALIRAESQAEVKAEVHILKINWLPYLALAVGYGMLVFATRQHWNEPLGAIVFTAIILTGLVVLRQFATVKENVRLHAEQTERQSEQHFRTLIENSSDIVMIFDREGKIAYQSPSVERILGYAQDLLIGKKGISFIHPEDRVAIKDAYQILAQNPQNEVMREYRFHHKDGSWCVLEGIAKILDDKDTGVKGILVNARDINERRVLESKLKHQAFHDPLTNLANRVLFRSRVEEALTNIWQTNSQIAVLFLDLDNFKNVNDSLGHDAGDRLLVGFTDRLRLCVRAKDTVARLGGDEFAILIEGEDLQRNAVLVAERILEKVQQPFQINNSAVKIGISIGIAFSDLEKTIADDLLRNADVAMYIAKSKGKNRFIVFENEMHKTLLAQIELENDLRLAIEAGQLTLNYQPIIGLNDGKITGMEALARWNHPTRGFVPPNDFIPIAEQTGLIIHLGRWIMREACRETQKLFDKYGNDLSVTINISGRQIQHPDFVRDLSDVLIETKIKPENLILELTESVMMENTEAMLKLLHQIRSLGIRLAIDDFGTGYSSLSYLQQFPIDILKIDRSFVKGIEHSSQKNAVARTIVSLSNTLQLSTVAEGIENIEQSGVLRELGCEFGQGYFFARPMAIEDFEKMLVTSETSSAIFYSRSNELPELVSKSIN